MHRIPGINLNTRPATHNMPDVFCLFPAINSSRFLIPVPRKKAVRKKAAAAVSLKPQAGLTLSRGEVLQSTHAVSAASTNGAQIVQAGPLALAVSSATAVPGPAAAIQAGASAEISAVIYTSTALAASVSGRAVLALPQGGDASVSAALSFTLKVRDPVEPVVEVYSEARIDAPAPAD